MTSPQYILIWHIFFTKVSPPKSFEKCLQKYENDFQNEHKEIATEGHLH